MNILHKLGIYKKSEIDELIESTVNLLGSVDGVIEGAKLDRQCYKAAISAFREVNTVEHAVKVISEYCDITDCTECDFKTNLCSLKYRNLCEYDEGGKCEYDGRCDHRSDKVCVFANNPPCDWRVER